MDWRGWLFPDDHSRGSAADLDGEVGATVPGVDLAHAGKVEAGDGGLDGGDVFGVVEQGHGLGVVGFEDPAFFDPIGIEIGVDALEGGHKTGDEFFLAEFEMFVVSFEVVAAVEDVVAAVMLGGEVVGVFHQGEEGVAFFFGEVVPVIALAGELLLNGKHEDDGAHALEIEQALQVVTRQVRGDTRHEAGGGGGEDAVKGDCAGAGGYLELAAFIAADGLDGGVQPDEGAAAGEVGGQLVTEGLKTAFVSTETGGTRFEAGPHPGHVDLPGVFFTEFANQHRFPHCFVDLAAGVFAHPGVHCGFFKVFPVVGEAQEDTHQPEADFIDTPTQPGIEEGSRDGIEWVEFALVVHDGGGAWKLDLAAPAQFINETKHGRIGLEPVVVKLLDRPIPMRFLEPASQTTDEIGGFIEGHLVTGFQQIVRGSHTGDSRSYDGDLHIVLLIWRYLRFYGAFLLDLADLFGAPAQRLAQVVISAQEGNGEPQGSV